MENKNNTTFYSIGLNSIKKRNLKRKISFKPEFLNLLVRLKILFN